MEHFWEPLSGSAEWFEDLPLRLLRLMLLLWPGVPTLAWELALAESAAKKQKLL